jgi:hypothetical protein
MKRLFASFAVCALLAGCSGVPLRSIPKLLQLNSQLLEANPAEVIVALQVDARLVRHRGPYPCSSSSSRPATRPHLPPWTKSFRCKWPWQTQP